MIRVTGGEFRGRNLTTLAGPDSRPTLSKVREAVFNILGEDVVDSRFLDLYCGVGVMGIEALSRGAASAAFVDRDTRCREALGRNLALLGVEARTKVFLAEAVGWLRRNDLSYEVIFADPPYGSQSGCKVLKEIAVTRDDQIRWVMIQHGKSEELPDAVEFLVRVRSRRYGDTVVDFYQPAVRERNADNLPQGGL